MLDLFIVASSSDNLVVCGFLIVPVIGYIQMEPQFTHGREKAKLHILEKISGYGIVHFLHV
jgi:hypothetical protein